MWRKVMLSASEGGETPTKQLQTKGHNNDQTKKDTAKIKLQTKESISHGERHQPKSCRKRETQQQSNKGRDQTIQLQTKKSLSI